MTLREKHNLAMDQAEQAFRIAQVTPADAYALFEKAYWLEREIADSIEAREENEPSRSIFYISAASLALNAKLYREAEVSAASGLIGQCSPGHLDELRNIFDQANFERHLSLRGVELDNNEFQLSFVGDEVGAGYIKGAELIDRLNIIADVTRREIEKKAKKKFNNQGRPSKVVDMHSLYFSPGMVGSYRIVIRLGGNRENERSLFGSKYDVEREVILSIIKKVELLNENALDLLKAEYEEEDPYYDFFITSMKSFAPDGEKIKMIGFTTLIDGEERSTSFTRKREEIGYLPTPEEDVDLTKEEGKIINVEGVLDVSRSRKTAQFFEVMSDEGKTFKFTAKEGELASIVRDNYKKMVAVKGKRKKGKREIYEFISIRNINE